MCVGVWLGVIPCMSGFGKDGELPGEAVGEVVGVRRWSIGWVHRK